MCKPIWGMQVDIKFRDCSLIFVFSKRTVPNGQLKPALKALLGQSRTLGQRLPVQTEPHLRRHVCGSAPTSAAPLFLSPQYTIRCG